MRFSAVEFPTGDRAEWRETFYLVMSEEIVVRSPLELNILVAETVVGGSKDEIPNYCNDMNEAWMVAQKLAIGVVPYRRNRSEDKFVWIAGVFDDEIYVDGNGVIDGHCHHYAIAETPAIAICLAALELHGLSVSLEANYK